MATKRYIVRSKEGLVELHGSSNKLKEAIDSAKEINESGKIYTAEVLDSKIGKVVYPVELEIVNELHQQMVLTPEEERELEINRERAGNYNFEIGDPVTVNGDKFGYIKGFIDGDISLAIVTITEKNGKLLTTTEDITVKLSDLTISDTSPAEQESGMREHHEYEEACRHIGEEIMDNSDLTDNARAVLEHNLGHKLEEADNLAELTAEDVIEIYLDSIPNNYINKDPALQMAKDIISIHNYFLTKKNIILGAVNTPEMAAEDDSNEPIDREEDGPTNLSDNLKDLDI